MGKRRNKESKVRQVKWEPSWEPEDDFKITPKQKEYLEVIEKKDVTFALGVAGTGKTWWAVKMALEELQKGSIKKIVLTRPIVESVEKLGFLPGTLQEKIHPYLIPLYDAINEIVGPQEFQRMKELDQIELAPLAYMRGRTLKRAFIILDEAQNTTEGQLKMFLTRLGQGSKMVITGDLTQIDIPKNQSSLLNIEGIMHQVPTVGFVRFDSKDTVRHPSVQLMIDAYEQYEKRQAKRVSC